MFTVQAPHGQVEVRAPQRFLRGLVEWCDGTRTIAQVVELGRRRWGESRFPWFLDAMLDEGVLVPESVAIVRAFRRSSPERSNPQPPPRQDLLARPQAALEPQDRIRSFVQSARLDELLVACRASGSLPLEVLLLLTRPIGTAPTGLYRLGSAAEATWPVSRESPLSGEVWRAVDDPLALSRAVGLLLITAQGAHESEGGSGSAARRLLLNVGAVRHQLIQAAMQTGFHAIDDFSCSERILHECGCLRSGTLLHALTLGMPPSEAESLLDCQVRWMDGPAHRGLFIARATGRQSPDPAAGLVAWGRSYKAGDAFHKAVAEYAERVASRGPIELRLVRADELGSVVDPESIVRYSAQQYASGRLNVKRFDRRNPHWWTQGTEWSSAAAVWLPADCVVARQHLPVAPGEPLLIRLTTSGCASGPTRAAAIESAAYELIERDALARQWLAQEPAVVIDRDTLPQCIAHRVRMLQTLACEVFVLSTTRGLGPVILVLIRSRQHGFSCVGAACGPDRSAAVERAFIEAECSALTRCHGVVRQDIRPRSVHLPEHHAAIHAHRSYWQRTAFLVGDAPAAVALSDVPWPADLRARLGKDRPLFWVALTGGWDRLPSTGEPVHTVRAIIPGCIPLAFGYDALPRGMVSHAVPARGRFPHPLA